MTAEKRLPVVSVVVAVYNMREHIRQCVESVLNQSFPHLELILVDDASTDGTVEILHEYEQCDGRVRLIRREANGGAQLARNDGIAVSRGKYIITVDHDDMLERDALRLAVETFRRHEGLQCVCMREVRLLPDGGTIEHGEKNCFGIISGEEAYRRSIGWRGITGRMMVTRELQTRFPFDNCERVYGEDNTAQLQFLASPHVCSCDGIYYHRLLDTSLSHKVSLNNIRGNLRFIAMRRHLQELGYGEEILRLNETAFWDSIIASCHYYHLNRNRFSASDRKEALHLITMMREQAEMRYVNLPARLRPGHMRMPCRRLFLLQTALFFALRHLLKGEEDILN